MMNSSRIALVIDSCTDVSPQDIEKYGMYVVPLQVNYSHETYLDKVTITPQEVYDRFSEEIPTTSTPTPAVVKEVFDRVVADGYTQAVVVTISSGLSATYELLRSVAVGIPNFEFAMVDSKSIGMGAGLVALAVARKLEEGVTLAEIEKEGTDIAERSRVFFCVDTLEYLHKGGRIGSVSYAVGNLLDMRPVISCNDEGTYCTVAKAKGRKQSLKKTMKCVEDFAAGYERCTIAVVNGDAVQEAKDVLCELQKSISHATDWFEGQISPVLVVHTGPGLIGIGVQCD